MPFIVAHQDDCQMVTGVEHTETVYFPAPWLANMVQSVEVSSGNGRRQCTCDPELVPLHYTGGDDSIPGYTIPRWSQKT